MHKIRLFALFIISLLFLSTACHQQEQKTETISVSIDPLRYVTEQIVGNDFQIQVLVPPGSSPETYEPTSAQMLQTARSKAFIDIGLLDFEIKLEQAIRDNMPQVTLIKSSERVPLLAGACGHTHADQDQTHGTDPHIWLSPYPTKNHRREHIQRNISYLSGFLPNTGQTTKLSVAGSMRWIVRSTVC